MPESILLDEVQVADSEKRRAKRRKGARVAHRSRKEAAAHALECAEVAARNCGAEFDPDTFQVTLNGGSKTANAAAVAAATKAHRLARRAK
ncbi:hypothetical protein FJZ28_04940 [Candidatus Peregrinibacteria bacterium]|nr:hypothetical protein [Candidatus Peregrinibacteria bacterium]